MVKIHQKQNRMDESWCFHSRKIAKNSDAILQIIVPDPCDINSGFPSSEKCREARFQKHPESSDGDRNVKTKLNLKIVRSNR
jgi:hypothetical protein